MLEHVSEITYRGSLKSCNYTCSYCPFGKKKPKQEAVSLDQSAWNRFCTRLSDIGFETPVNLLIAPYGEALIHSYYRESVAELSRKPYIRMVGCQTNLSFPSHIFLRELATLHADMEKISLWATFHPEMTDLQTFIRQVEQLSQVISLSVGVVGNPAHIPLILELREKLPPQIYLWVNAMDGLGRRYTPEEISCFQSVDPMFFWEIEKRKDGFCLGGSSHVFVTADGSLYPCNRMRQRIGRVYDRETEFIRAGCSGAKCDCYLAYSHSDAFVKQNFFGYNSLFRVPERRKVSALFVDVDGTLIGKDGKISTETKKAVEYLAGRTKLFFATELPMDLALRKCASIRTLFLGGCFSGGAHCVHWGDGFEEIVPLPPLSDGVERRAIHIERQQGVICRILLPSREDVSNEFDQNAQSAGHFSLVRKGTDKFLGIQTLCRHLGISPGEVMAVGNGKNDSSMIRECRYGIAVGESGEKLKETADFVLEVYQLAYIL